MQWSSFLSTQESLIKYLTEWGGKEKCRLIKEGDHVQFGYDIRKITYGRRKDATDYSGKNKVYADFRSALEHQESVIINNDLFRKDPNPGVAKFFTIEYKVAYDHFNTELESDRGTYKRRAVYEGGRMTGDEGENMSWTTPEHFNHNTSIWMEFIRLFKGL
ncbi:hypothetical protein FSHL1_012716 [Fusarium sambucinum]